MNSSIALCWFRRDLRIHDHAALFHALKNHERVYCAFVFDNDILDALTKKEDRRVEFIWHSIAELNQELGKHGGELIVRHGRAADEIPKLATELKVQAVYANHDYEPRAIGRDQAVAATLAKTDAEIRELIDSIPAAN